MKTETITWHYLPELPDDNVTCLLAIDTEDTDEVVIGFREDGRWMKDVGDWVEPLFLSKQEDNEGVYAWAHAPAKPAKKAKSS